MLMLSFSGKIKLTFQKKNNTDLLRLQKKRRKLRIL